MRLKKEEREGAEEGGLYPFLKSPPYATAVQGG